MGRDLPIPTTTTVAEVPAAVPKCHQRLVVATPHFQLFPLQQTLLSRNASKEESRVGSFSTRRVGLVWAFARRLRTRAIGLETA